MTLSKTWLKDNPHLLDYVKIDGYEVKFRNREHTRGVGVGLYIRPDIKYKLGQVGWTSFMTFILCMLQMEQLNCYFRNNFRSVRNKLKTKIKSTKSNFYRKALSGKKSSEVWKVIHKILNPNGKRI